MRIGPEAEFWAIGRGALLASASAAFLILLAVTLNTLEYLTEDDAYIHLRMVRNWLAGEGLAYNSGTAVLASSSPGWLLLLAGVGLFFGTGPVQVAVINSIALVACCFLVGGWLKRVLALGLLAPAALGQMEVTAAVALLAAAVRLQSTHPRAMALFAAAATIVRVEFAIVSTFLLWSVRSNRRESVLWFGLVIASVCLWLQLEYGSPVPQSIRAKSVIYDVSTAEFFGYIVSLACGDRLFGMNPWLGAIFLLSVVIGAAFWLDKSERNGWPFWAATFLTVTGYAIRGVLPQPWYIPIIVAPLLFTPAASRSLVLLPLLVPAAIGWNDLGAAFTDPTRASGYERGMRAHRLLEIGSSLARRPECSSLLAPEIGGLGWSFPGPVIDAMGLATPESLRFHPVADRVSGASGVVPPRMIEELRPPCMAGLEGFFPRSPLSEYERTDVPLLGAYGEPLSVWRSSAISVFVRP